MSVILIGLQKLSIRIYGVVFLKKSHWNHMFQNCQALGKSENPESSNEDKDLWKV